MKITTPITIAIPGEKRNGKIVKEFLRRNGIIKENDMNQELISAPKIQARFVQMRAYDALQRIGKSVEIAITGLDQMREYIQDKERMDGTDILGFYVDEGGRGFCNLRRISKKDTYTIPFVLDDGNPTKIQLLVPDEKIGDNLNMADTIIEGVLRGEIRLLTPYPNLVSKVLRKNTGIPIFGNDFQKVDGKTEALIRAGLGDFGIDVVDTGETAKKNGLTPTEVLYESYPAGIVSTSELEQDKRLQDIIQILTNASNNDYYSSSKYRNRYPRG